MHFPGNARFFLSLYRGSDRNHEGFVNLSLAGSGGMCLRSIRIGSWRRRRSQLIPFRAPESQTTTTSAKLIQSPNGWLFIPDASFW